MRNSSEHSLIHVFVNPLWVGGQTWVSTVGLVPLDALWKTNCALLLLSGFHHHHAPSTFATYTVSSQPPLTALRVWSKPLSCGDLQVKSSCVQRSTEGWILVALGQEHFPKLSRASGDPVHCHSWFPAMSCSTLHSSCLLVPWPALWVSWVPYDTTVKAGC